VQRTAMPNLRYYGALHLIAFPVLINYKYFGAPACSADRLHRKRKRKRKTLRPCASAVKIQLFPSLLIKRQIPLNIYIKKLPIRE
jgi:hypothetical protein